MSLVLEPARNGIRSKEMALNMEVNGIFIRMRVDS